MVAMVNRDPRRKSNPPRVQQLKRDKVPFFIFVVRVLLGGLDLDKCWVLENVWFSFIDIHWPTVLHFIDFPKKSTQHTQTMWHLPCHLQSFQNTPGLQGFDSPPSAPLISPWSCLFPRPWTWTGESNGCKEGNWALGSTATQLTRFCPILLVKMWRLWRIRKTLWCLGNSVFITLNQIGHRKAPWHWLYSPTRPQQLSDARGRQPAQRCHRRL